MKKKSSFCLNKFENDLFNNDKDEKDKEELSELLNKSPLNISTCLMKICQNNNYKPLSIGKYYESIFTEMDSLKRTNGSKYKSKSIKAVRSAIVSNNLFIKNKDNLYSLNIKECIKYLKLLQNSLEKNKSSNKMKNKSSNKKYKNNYNINNSDNNNVNFFLGKKRNNSDDNENQIEKYRHVYELMEKTLEMYSKDKELNKKIKIHFPKCNNYKDIMEKYNNNESIIEGMLSMFNYFKPFLKNKLFSLNEMNYLNNLNSMIDEFKEELKISKSFLQ